VDSLDAPPPEGHDLHPPPTAPNHNASPPTILLGRQWPQGIASPTTVIFLDNLGCMLLCVGNTHIPRALKEEPGLPTTITTIGGTVTSAWSLNHVIIINNTRDNATSA
jgi:hypothetical protein